MVKTQTISPDLVEDFIEWNESYGDTLTFIINESGTIVYFEEDEKYVTGLISDFKDWNGE